MHAMENQFKYCDKMQVRILYWPAMNEANFRIGPDVHKIEVPLVSDFKAFKSIVADKLGSTAENITINTTQQKSDYILLMRRLKNIAFFSKHKTSGKQPSIPKLYVYDKKYVDFTKDTKSILFGARSQKIRSQL